jgi:hypothetical protein
MAGAAAAPCSARAGDVPSAPRIVLKPGEAGRWRVEYALAAPQAKMGFVRVPNDWRARHWAPADDAFEIVYADGETFARRKDGAPFERVAFDIPARYRHLPKDYAPFSPFSDGGLLIHTGQFHACPGAAPCPDIDSWPMALVPPAGERAIVSGRIHEGEARFASGGDGRNVYVGAAEPLETDHFIAVVDSGFPAEARQALDALLPALMDLFAERLGALARKPMLFASLDPYPPPGSGFNHQGGTLPDQIFIHLYGEEWAENAAQALHDLLPWFFAHEAAHLFQQEGLAGVFNTDQAWIHEGGAEALAALALLELGGVEPGYVKNRIRSASDACAAGLTALEGEPLNASAQAGAFGNYYACGLLIHLAIDAETRRASDGATGLFDVWTAYRARLESGAPATAAFAETLATTSQPDPAAFLRAGLDRAEHALEDRREPLKPRTP